MTFESAKGIMLNGSITYTVVSNVISRVIIISEANITEIKLRTIRLNVRLGNISDTSLGYITLNPCPSQYIMNE